MSEQLLIAEDFITYFPVYVIILPSDTVMFFLLLPLLTLHIKTIPTGLSVQQD
jgi:hypothetical protein